MQNLFKSGSRGKSLSPSVFSEPLFTIVPGFKNYLSCATYQFILGIVRHLLEEFQEAQTIVY